MRITGGLLPTACLLAMFAYGLYTTGHYLLVAEKPWAEEVTIGSIIHGQTAQAIEAGLEQDVSVRSFAIQTWNAIGYGIFGQARVGTLVGSQAWLFTDEEFVWTKDSMHNLDANLDSIAQSVEALHRKGIKVALLFVPAKADIYSEQLGGYQLPETQEALYSMVLSRAQSTGADFIPDLRSAFLANKTDELFLRSDTHWSVAGARLAARLVCDLSRSALPEPVAFDQGEQPPVTHRGDLTNFLALGPYERWLALPSDTIVPVTSTPVVAELSADALFGGARDDLSIPVTLVGTSYSANPLWSFEALLRLACQQDILNVAADGEGPFDPMRNYLSDLETASGANPKLVIWELPIRYLDDAPSPTTVALQAH
jgi:alginate O-acetyltransferase complex protein AlgJ